jgi:hypothetical protein
MPLRPAINDNDAQYSATVFCGLVEQALNAGPRVRFGPIRRARNTLDSAPIKLSLGNLFDGVLTHDQPHCVSGCVRGQPAPLA